MKFKYSIFQDKSFISGLSKLASSAKLSIVSHVIPLSKLLVALNKEEEYMKSIYKTLITEFGTVAKDGSISISKDSKEFTLFNKQVSELLNNEFSVEFEILDITELVLSTAGIELSAYEIVSLNTIINITYDN